MSLIVPPHVAQARAKAALEAVVHKHRCGNCFFGSREMGVPEGQVRCEGMPPTPLVIGAVQGPDGSVQPNIVHYRPNLPDALKGCALWGAKDIPGAEVDGSAN